jgi:hypothetical protein
MKPIENQFDAIVMALQLAISAPDEQKAQACIEHAEQLAVGLSEIEIERAKKMAQENLIETK